VAAAAGVVLGAAAMLRLYRLTMSAPVANVQLSPFHVQSPISNLQSSMFPLVPLLAWTIWIAAYPPAFISRLDSSVSRVMARVNNTAPANANCDAPPAPPPPVPSPSASAGPPDFLMFAACGEEEKASGKRGGR
jgi:hypothetical protein